MGFVCVNRPYIEMFYNTRRQHGHNNGLSPVEFEKQRSK
ncbi:IS3 family transposase [Xanthomonas translucens pv. graminis]|nr:IS3 family transposase [Xanthomonas translucens pv. graminis]